MPRPRARHHVTSLVQRLLARLIGFDLSRLDIQLSDAAIAEQLHHPHQLLVTGRNAS